MATADDGGGVIRINVWSTPRTLSTATMYSFAQRPDTVAIDEPLYAHHMTQCPHLQAKRPYIKELFEEQSQDGAKVIKDVILGPLPEGKKVLYIKHMAKHIINLDLSFLSKTKNILLIRDPIYMLSSFQNKIQGSMEETGYPELVQLYSAIEQAGQRPLVVDSDALQRDPRGILTELCHQLGISFLEGQLSWPVGPKACDGCWANFWYDNVHASTGFQSVTSSTGKGYRRFPPELFPLLRMSQPFYEALQIHAIKPVATAIGSKNEGETTDHGLKRTLAPDRENLDLLIWVGGQLLPRERAKVSVFDSTVQGGDAVWEGLRVYNGRVMKLKEHLQRLQDSAKAMDFKGIPSKNTIKEALFTTLAANGMRDGAHVRLTLSRGLKTTSSMNPAFNVYGCCLIIVPEHKPVGGVATYDNESGIRLITASQRRNPPHCVDSKIHHNNLINNILAKIEANQAGAADAIMLDVDGYVSETNATNLFMVKRGMVMTPHADHCLRGITRQTVMDLVVHKLGLPLVERRLSLSEFQVADEVFTTGTMGELTPVDEIDGRCIKAAADDDDDDDDDDDEGFTDAGRKGKGSWPITRQIQEAYRRLTESEGESLPF